MGVSPDKFLPATFLFEVLVFQCECPGIGEPLYSVVPPSIERLLLLT